MSNGAHNPGPRSSSTERDGKLLEACLIPLDPALDGFFGALVELNEHRIKSGATSPEVRSKSRYEVVQSAAMSGNVISRISCEEEATARRVYANLCNRGVYPAT